MIDQKTELAWLLPPVRLLQEKAEAPVLLRDVQSAAGAPLTPALGRSPDGEAVALDLAQLPHLSVAGTSGAGKSTLLRTLLTSLLVVSTPDDLELILIDMDGEMDALRGLPHLRQDPIEETAAAVAALDGLAAEIDRRRELFHSQDVYNISDYNVLNTLEGEQLPRILCVVDEFAAMISTSYRKQVEAAVSHIGRRGRKYGIHLVLATQDPYSDVLTKNIRANMPGRLTLHVNDLTASRVAIGVKGAESLGGDGDALLKDPWHLEPRHFQVAWTSRDVLKKVIEHWQRQGEAHPKPVVPNVDSEPEPVNTYRVTVKPRRRYGWLVAAAVIGVGWLGVQSLGSGAPLCPPGTTYLNSALMETCDYPNQQTYCTISARGFSPNPGEGTYATKPPEGVWCRNAHDQP